MKHFCKDCKYYSPKKEYNCQIDRYMRSFVTGRFRREKYELKCETENANGLCENFEYKTQVKSHD